MELPYTIAAICENACKDIEHANQVLSDPYAPMHKWPIDLQDNANSILKSHNLSSYVLSEAYSIEFPRLAIYMNRIKINDEKKRKMEEEKRKKEMSFEFQLELRESEVKMVDNDITSNIREIARLEALLLVAKEKQQKLADLYLNKSVELAEFKRNPF